MELYVSRNCERSGKITLVNETYSDYSTYEITDDEKRKGRVTFPQKLHAIVSNPEYQHIICWMPHGRSWKIVDKDRLASVVCFENFNHESFASFCRSVNGWNFKRMADPGPDQGSYYHEMFLRGKPDVAQLMTRYRGTSRKLPDTQREPNFYKISERFPLPKGDDHSTIYKSHGQRAQSLTLGCASEPSLEYRTSEQHHKGQFTSSSGGYVPNGLHFDYGCVGYREYHYGHPLVPFPRSHSERCSPQNEPKYYYPDNHQNADSFERDTSRSGFDHHMQRNRHWDDKRRNYEEYHWDDERRNYEEYHREGERRSYEEYHWEGERRNYEEYHHDLNRRREYTAMEQHRQASTERSFQYNNSAQVSEFRPISAEKDGWVDGFVSPAVVFQSEGHNMDSSQPSSSIRRKHTSHVQKSSAHENEADEVHDFDKLDNGTVSPAGAFAKESSVDQSEGNNMNMDSFQLSSSGRREHTSHVQKGSAYDNQADEAQD